MMWTFPRQPMLSCLRHRSFFPATSVTQLVRGYTGAAPSQSLNQGSTWVSRRQLVQGYTWAASGQPLNQGSTWVSRTQLVRGYTWAAPTLQLKQGSTWVSRTPWLRSPVRIVCMNTRTLHCRQLVLNTAKPSTRLLPQNMWRLCLVRHSSSQWDHENKSGLLYILAVGVFMLGMAYAGVPMYQMFCQATGLGGQAKEGHDTSKVESMSARKERVIRVKFTADTASSMQWNFRPEQSEVKVAPGETALAFYKARNPTDKAIIGISTYNIIPFDAGQYFNKIQCFCFEEQRLNPKEEVDMPVFFFIDPEFADDPRMEGTDTITLSYTFFESKHGMNLPLPGYMTQTATVHQ